MSWYRRRNWIVRRLVLGLAVAAVAAPVAQARVDETPGQQAQAKLAQPEYIPFGDYPSGSTVEQRTAEKVVSVPQGLPHAGLQDWVQYRDGIEAVRGSQLRGDSSDRIEFVRNQPRGTAEPTLVSSPSFNWGDAGIGAGIALALVLLAGGALVATRQVTRPQAA